MKFGFATVSFNICLIYYINSVFVTQIKKGGIRRIMRSSNTISIILLNKAYIRFHFFYCHSIACFWHGIVMINTQKLNWLIIKIKSIALNFNMFKTDIFPNCLNNFLTIWKSDNHIIKIRTFSRPRVNIKIFKANLLNIARWYINRFRSYKLVIVIKRNSQSTFVTEL